MTALPPDPIARFIRTAAPVAVLCVIAALPAHATTISASAPGAGASTASAGQLTKQQVKVQKKAEKKARKQCKKLMKQARKRGQTYSCTPAAAAPDQEVVADNSAAPAAPAATAPEPAATPPSPPAPAPSAAPAPQNAPNASSSTPAPGGSSKAPVTTPAAPPAPPAPPASSDPGETDNVVRNALLGKDSIPGPFTGPVSDNPPIEMLTPVAVVPPNEVPEPGSLALLGLGLLGLSRVASRKKSRAG